MGLCHPPHQCQGAAQGNSPVSPKAATSPRSCWGHCSRAARLISVLKPSPCYHLVVLYNIKQRPLEQGWTCSGMHVHMHTHGGEEEVCEHHMFWSEARREVEGRCRNGQHAMGLSFLLIPLFSFPLVTVLCNSSAGQVHAEVKINRRGVLEVFRKTAI